MDKWKCVVLNLVENLLAELNFLKDSKLDCKQSPKNSCVSLFKECLLDVKQLVCIKISVVVVAVC